MEAQEQGDVRPLPDQIWQGLTVHQAFQLGIEYEHLRALFSTAKPRAVRRPVATSIAHRLADLFAIQGYKTHVYWIGDDIDNMRFVYLEPPPESADAS